MSMYEQMNAVNIKISIKNQFIVTFSSFVNELVSTLASKLDQFVVNLIQS